MDLDNELYVEHGETRYGPYRLTSGPIPLHRYRRFKKTKAEQRADCIETLAERLVLSKSALSGSAQLSFQFQNLEIPEKPFDNPDPLKNSLIQMPFPPKRQSQSIWGIWAESYGFAPA